MTFEFKCRKLLLYMTILNSDSWSAGDGSASCATSSTTSTGIPSAYGVETISAKEIPNFGGSSEDTDDDSYLDTLFDQFLCSPSPSLSPKDATSDLTDLMLRVIDLVIPQSH
jgi:hypothetical protein